MRKVGKYEKMRKKALLQSYVSSLVCLALCMTMFMGSSYAWFTSEVENTGNEMYIGTLDVGFFMENESATSDTDKWQNLSTTENPDVKFFDDTVRWEPGYTMLETVRVLNEGDLAFNYVLNFTDGKLGNVADSVTIGTEANAGTESAEGAAATAAEELAKVAKFFDVWVFKHEISHDDEGKVVDNYTKPDSYAKITTDSGWIKVGTLADILGGTAVLTGKMELDDVRDAANLSAKEGLATEHIYTIALHMSEEATQTEAELLMGKKIGLNVKLVAYQLANENDGLGNSNYDQIVTNAEELAAAFQKGGTIALATDIELKDTQLSVAKDVSVFLDLNGHAISQTKACTENHNMIINQGNLTITGNGKISLNDTGANNASAWGAYTIRNEGTLVVDNGTIENIAPQSTSNVNNAIFNYAGSTTINGGVISAPYSRSVRLWQGNLTINGGEFDGQVWVQPQSNECKLTITGGSFKPGSQSSDKSSVFVTNDEHDVDVLVTGGNFATKFGCSNASNLAGCIQGGTFTDEAKNNTSGELFASNS